MDIQVDHHLSGDELRTFSTFADALPNLIFAPPSYLPTQNYTYIKKNTLDKADYITFWLLMCVDAEKESQILIYYFLSISCQLLSPQF